MTLIMRIALSQEPFEKLYYFYFRLSSENAKLFEKSF